MNVNVIKPISYCYGVKRAIDMVTEIAKENQDKKLYCLGKIVNNNDVVNQLKELNIITLDVKPSEYFKTLEQIEENSIVFFSAHGHDKKLEELLKEKNIEFYSTTCPIITKMEETVISFLHDGYTIIFIGVKNHPETEAFISLDKNIIVFDVVSDNFINLPASLSDKVVVFNQSTLSDELLEKPLKKIREISPNVKLKTEFCNTTKTRNILLINSKVANSDLVLIIGSHSSSNCTRLFEKATSLYPTKTIIFVENLNNLKNYGISHYTNASVLSGTSTPMSTIESIVNYLHII